MEKQKDVPGGLNNSLIKLGLKKTFGKWVQSNSLRKENMLQNRIEEGTIELLDRNVRLKP